MLRVGWVRKGSITAVLGSGIRSMSDSWISWKPRIDDPSKPYPSSNASSESSWAGTEKCCMRPGKSQKRKSMTSIPWSRTNPRTSLGVRCSTLKPPSQRPGLRQRSLTNPGRWRSTGLGACRPAISRPFLVHERCVKPAGGAGRMWSTGASGGSMAFMERQLEYVLRTVEERNVRFVRLWFTDVQGMLKSFAITPAELEDALESGMEFDGSCIDGFSRIQEADMLARPDPGTFELVHIPGEEAPVARMFCDIHTPSGEPFDGDPRYVLKRTLEKARERGFTFYVSPEMEYFYFRSAAEPIPLDQASYFDLTPSDEASELRKQTILALENMGIPVQYSHHEIAPSQQEIDLRYTDALPMPDNDIACRMLGKEATQTPA